MSDHADTIRAGISHTSWAMATSKQHPSFCKGCPAEDALDALLAERQQAQEEIEAGVARILELRDQRRQAIDALRRVNENAKRWHGLTDLSANGHARALKVIGEWCDAVLEKLGDKS